MISILLFLLILSIRFENVKARKNHGSNVKILEHRLNSEIALRKYENAMINQQLIELEQSLNSTNKVFEKCVTDDQITEPKKE